MLIDSFNQAFGPRPDDETRLSTGEWNRQVNDVEPPAGPDWDPLQLRNNLVEPTPPERPPKKTIIPAEVTEALRHAHGEEGLRDPRVLAAMRDMSEKQQYLLNALWILRHPVRTGRIMAGAVSEATPRVVGNIYDRADRLERGFDELMDQGPRALVREEPERPATRTAGENRPINNGEQGVVMGEQIDLRDQQNINQPESEEPQQDRLRAYHQMRQRLGLEQAEPEVNRQAGQQRDDLPPSPSTDDWLRPEWGRDEDLLRSPDVLPPSGDDEILEAVQILADQSSMGPDPYGMAAFERGLRPAAPEFTPEETAVFEQGLTLENAGITPAQMLRLQDSPIKIANLQRYLQYRASKQK